MITGAIEHHSFVILQPTLNNALNLLNSITGHPRVQSGLLKDDS